MPARRSPKSAVAAGRGPLIWPCSFIGGIMDLQKSYDWRRQLLWGLFLIGLGTAFLFDRMDMFDMLTLWQYWPMLFVFLGINKMIGAPSARHVASGLRTVFTGLWLFACFQHLYGMTFHNSWPLLLIVWGATMVITPFLKTRLEQNTEYSNEK
jgi:hypothetical protein